MQYPADEEGAVGGWSETTVVFQYVTRATTKAAQTNIIMELLSDIRYRRDPHMIVDKGNRMTKIFAELQKLHNAHYDDFLLKKGARRKALRRWSQDWEKMDRCGSRRFSWRIRQDLWSPG